MQEESQTLNFSAPKEKMAIKALALALLCNLICSISAQGGLPDSISDVDCFTLQMSAPHICCEPDTGNFCQIQCNNGLCRCVNPLTGVPIGDFTFLESDESIDCSLIIPDPPATTLAPVTTPEPAVTTDDEEETSRSDSDSTNSTRSGDSGDGSGDSTDSSRSDSSRSNNTRSDSSRSGSSRSNGTRSDRTDGSGGSSGRDRSDSTGRSDSDTNNTRSDSTNRVRCPRVSQLLAEDECVLSCIVEDDDGCPACNDTCFDLVPSGPLASDVPCNCTINQICLRVGRFGEFRCVDLLSEGERCDSGRYDDDDEDDKDDKDGSGDMDRSDKDKKSRTERDADETSDSSALGRIGGAKDRHNFGDLGGATVGCQEGLVCTPVSIGRSECLPENSDGACVIARQQGLDVQCSPDGAFEPLQVHTDEDQLYHVVCVIPSDGSPISGTEVIVADMDDAPDCDRLVGCSVERGGQSFDVPHGDFFIYVDDNDDDDKSDSDDDDNCQRCLCRNGEATLCESANCTSLQPLGCSYQGQSYNHGDTFDVDCNVCGCRNGQIRCTRTQCARSQIRDRCQECMNEPLNQVCGINGVTYDSPCAAIYCAGLAPFDFFQGACSIVDVCSLYPCQDGETCVRKGGATCFDSNGCDPDDLRLCVDPNSLVCDDDDNDDDDEVCATNGVTYSSLCRLLQDTGNEAVAYAGECDREECRGGKVCGTDGETYDSVCVLRAQSANARVDYDGECDDDLEDKIEEICERVSSSGRCSYNSSNCHFLVDPEEGCCALCGGIVFIAMNLAGLREYVRINPSVRTLDDFIELLVDSDFISDEITERCELEGSLTVSGNIQITLTARSDDEADVEFCNAASEKIAAAINDLSLVPQSAQVPEVLQFANAALAAPNTATTVVANTIPEVVGSANPGVNPGANGAPVLKVLSYLTLLLLVALSFVLF